MNHGVRKSDGEELILFSGGPQLERNDGHRRAFGLQPHRSLLPSG